jgi:hypothetical protein
MKSFVLSLVFSPALRGALNAVSVGDELFPSIHLYTLTNASGRVLKITNYGAILETS